MKNSAEIIISIMSSIYYQTYCEASGDPPKGATGALAPPTAPLKLRKTESSCLKEIPLQMLPMGMWGPENMKIKKFRWGLFDF